MCLEEDRIVAGNVYEDTIKPWSGKPEGERTERRNKSEDKFYNMSTAIRSTGYTCGVVSWDKLDQNELFRCEH